MADAITSATTNTASKPTTSAAGTLSGWATPYVGDMLGKGMAYSNMDFDPYSGTKVAGPSNLQKTGFEGIAGLTTADKGPMDVFTSQQAMQYANPFVSNVISPQIREAQRQADIQRIQNAGRLVGSGAFGGSRQAIMESEGDRNLQTLLSDITGKGYQQAYENAQAQFERDRGYGLKALESQLAAGSAQRGIEQDKLSSDYQEYLREFNYPKEQLQFQSDLLKNIPEKALTTLNQYGTDASTLSKILGAGTGIVGLLSAMNTAGSNTAGLGNIYSGISNLFGDLFKDSTSGVFSNSDLVDYFGDDYNDWLTGSGDYGNYGE
jgi:hypothetical protein